MHQRELLPTPLYILYTQILAYKEAFDNNIELEIIGSAKNGQTVSRQQALRDSGSTFYGLETVPHAFLAKVVLWMQTLTYAKIHKALSQRR